MKKSSLIIFSIIFIILVYMFIVLSFCIIESKEETINDIEHSGKCIEYKTQYKIDCGLFVDSKSFCKERKYDVCVSWEE